MERLIGEGCELMAFYFGEDRDEASTSFPLETTAR